MTQLPPGQRVISALESDTLATTPLTHMIDRACLGRCYSYANYEPSSGQFRVRTTGPNAFVMDNVNDIYQAQLGSYVVKPRDLPLYQVVIAGGTVQVRELEAGQQSGIEFWDGL